MGFDAVQFSIYSTSVSEEPVPPYFSPNMEVPGSSETLKPTLANCMTSLYNSVPSHHSKSEKFVAFSARQQKVTGHRMSSDTDGERSNVMLLFVHRLRFVMQKQPVVLRRIWSTHTVVFRVTTP
jgi:hypothetical protein